MYHDEYGYEGECADFGVVVFWLVSVHAEDEDEEGDDGGEYHDECGEEHEDFVVDEFC